LSMNWMNLEREKEEMVFADRDPNKTQPRR
jgi:hypothetical protein